MPHQPHDACNNRQEESVVARGSKVQIFESLQGSSDVSQDETVE